MPNHFNSKNINGVFFDLYGTLFRYGDMDAAWDAWYHSFYSDLKNFKVTIGIEELYDKCTDLFSREVTAHDGPEPLTLYELRLSDLCRRIMCDVPEKEIPGIALRAMQRWHQYIHLDEEAVQVLQHLKRTKKLALITNFDHPPHIRDVLTGYGLHDYFDHVTISSETGLKKPDPRIFAMTLEKTGLAPGQVVFIGDSMEDDISGARAAGIFPILIQRNGENNRTDNGHSANQHIKKAKAAAVLTLKQLSDLLEYF